MHTQLENYFKEQTKVDDESLKEIIAHFKVIHTKRNEVLCSIGQVCKNFYFINKGCLRLYEIDNKGNEVTGFFALEDSIMSAIPSFILQKPSRDFLVLVCLFNRFNHFNTIIILYINFSLFV